jgi:signal peptidase I
MVKRTRIDAPLFMSLVVRLLQDGHGARFCAVGTSMAPAIQDGDVITVEPIDRTTVQAGDIILYHHRERPVVHRVAQVRQNTEGRTVIVVRGDGKAADDAPIEPSQILGKIVAIEPRTESRAARIRRAVTARLGLLLG